MFQVMALHMYLEVGQKERADDREWQVKMALLTNNPAQYGPIVFPESKETEEQVEELRPGELTVSGFHPDVKVKYRDLPTPEEAEEILAQFDPEQVFGVEDFQVAKQFERMTNGRG